MLQLLFIVVFFGAASFYPVDCPAPPLQAMGTCVGSQPFHGYTFLDPNIINKNAAYAPFFARWDDYYERYYFDKSEDIQRQDNIGEWAERFCGKPEGEDVTFVVYKADLHDIAGLHDAAADPTKKTPLPYRLAGNTFAEIIAYNGCTEVTSYLMFAKKCEPFVTEKVSAWDINSRQSPEMITLIDEGLARFNDTKSHFVKLRYAYQIIRLAHYAHRWQYTVDLYDYLMPKIDRKKPSIVYYWTLGHLAGALQKLENYPEAAYRFSLIFRHCPSKRAQAYRSFLIRNDDDWEKTMRLCQNDAEKSTLLVLRAGGAKAFLIDDMTEVYDLDAANPQLDLMLVSEVQELEKIFLRTSMTDLQRGRASGSLQPKTAVQQLLDLQKFVRRVIREKKTPNPKMWRGIEGYLELLAGDKYAAKNRWDRLEDDLDNTVYEKRLLRQLKIWRCLLDIMLLDPVSYASDKRAFEIRGYEAFQWNPSFEPFLQQWLADGYANHQHPGKAILTAFSSADLGLSPRLEVYDDLLMLANSSDPILLERTMQLDTNPDRVIAHLLELKGAFLLSQGQPEAAVATMRKILPTQLSLLPKFSPFREKVGEKIHRIVTDTLLLNRLEIAQKMIDLEFSAKTAAALHDPEEARYWYKMGIGYYNMSYFGYEWEVTDVFRSGYNQVRLSQGPVFPLAGSPEGNRENTDLSLALSCFEKALRAAQDPEVAARAAFMAARCQQKQWLCTAACPYRSGSKFIPILPANYTQYYDLLLSNYADTKFYGAVVKECKWLAAYAH